MGDADAAVAADETALGYLSEHDWLLSSHVRWNSGWPSGSAVTSEERSALWRCLCRAAGRRRRLPRDAGRLRSRPRAARSRALGAALDTYQLGLLTCSQGGRELPAAGMAHIGLATLLYERGELDAALDHAVRVPLGRHLAFTQPMATGLATLAWIVRRRAILGRPGRDGGGPRRRGESRRRRTHEPRAGAPSTVAARPWGDRRGCQLGGRGPRHRSAQLS